MSESSQLDVSFSDPHAHKAPSIWTRIHEKWSALLGRLKYRFTLFITNYPTVLRWYFAWRRRTRPIRISGNKATVTRHKDVVDVLTRPEDLLLAEFLHPKMLGGHFLLSMDWRDQHKRERGALWSAVDQEHDEAYVRNLVADKCAELIKEAEENTPARHTLDVAESLSEEIAVHVLVNYLGIERTPELKLRLRNQASVIIVSPPENSEEKRLSEAIAAELSAYLDDQIEAKIDAIKRQSKKLQPYKNSQPLMERLCRISLKQQEEVQKAREKAPDEHIPDPWLNKDWIRRFLFGLLSTGSATIARATTQAFDRLMAHPAAFAQAKETAGRLTSAMKLAEANPTTALEADVLKLRNELQLFAYEALRFRPMLPMLGRFSPRETIVGKNQSEARKIPGGYRVVSPPIAAMFDPEVFTKPHSFSAKRPKQDYVHFGIGVHECFGRYLADTQIVEMFRILLTQKNIKRAGLLSGRVKYDGPAVKTLLVNFG